MDCDPPDHFQMPPRMIKLQSSDGEIFQVEVNVAKLSGHFKDMLDDLGVDENEVISIPANAPEISGAILGKIIQWANYHKDDPAAAEEEDEKKEMPTDDISSWDAEFLQVDGTTFFQMIRAANYLNVKGLLNVTCKTIAKMINGKSLEDVRQNFHIQNDFSPVEKKQLDKESSWFERSYYGFHVDESMTCSLTMRMMKNFDNEGRQVIQDCLTNSVKRKPLRVTIYVHTLPSSQHFYCCCLQIVRKILQHLPDVELDYFAYMNKMWNNEARSVMKKRGNLMARLTCCKLRPCQQNFEALAGDLQTMNVVPFSGVSIVMLSEGHTGGTLTLDPTHEAVITQLALKQLSVRLLGNWWTYKDCTAFVLVKKLLQNFSGLLEQLTLIVEEKRLEFIEQIFQASVFPRLKILNLTEFSYPSDEFPNYMKALISRAPNLKELHTDGALNLMENVLDGSSAVLVYKPVVRYPFDRISPSVMSALRLKRMELVTNDPEFDFEQFSLITPVLLEGSCTTTLRELRMDAVLAVPLMCYGICLENVKKLDILIHYNQLERAQPEILRILKDFDFTRIFPNLKKVEISSNSTLFVLLTDVANAVVEQANAVLREPKTDRAASIKVLDIKFLSNTNAPFYAEMFPMIEKLEAFANSDREIPFDCIWRYWVSLKELKLTQVFRPIVNLDSVFCGIFPEEVAELRLKDEGYLKSVNIVPVMPAVTCLKSLATLTFTCNGQWNEQYVDDGTLLFSKVTGLLAFTRNPSLAVRLEFQSQEILPAMRHLEAFASVTTW